MSIIATAKTKTVKGNVKEAFKNEEGAIDLASIMVGIIVIGLIGGVIAATVFAVIPWAQDNAAKQQLDSVAAAQSAYIGLTSDGDVAYSNGGATGKIITHASSGNLFDGTNTTVIIKSSGQGKDAHYGAVAKSSSGKWFKVTDSKTQPTDIGKKSAAGTDLEGGTTAYDAAYFANYAAIDGAK